MPQAHTTAPSPPVGHQNAGSLSNQQLQTHAKAISIGVMITALLATLAYVRAFLIARHCLAMEAGALRQQLAVYKRKQPRPKLNRFDRLFWVVVRRIWTNWSEALILVKPDTVVSWHRAGYRLFWTWRSRRQRVGRPQVAEEVRDLIRRMKRENPIWGAPRGHGIPAPPVLCRLISIEDAWSAAGGMLRTSQCKEER